MTTRLKYRLIVLATMTAWSSVCSQGLHAADGIDPAAMPAVLSDAGDVAPEAMIIDDRIMLDPDAGGSVSGEVPTILKKSRIQPNLRCGRLSEMMLITKGSLA